MEQKFTQMAQEALSDAVQNAAALGNPQVDTLHLLDAMLRQENSMARALIEAAGGNAQNVSAEVHRAMQSLPSASGSTTTQPDVSRQLSAVLSQAEKEMQRRGDEYVTVDLMLVAIAAAKPNQSADILEKNGLTADKLRNALTAARGSDRKVTSADAEGSYKALEKYSTDLTAAAKEGKLDPVIGRDQEIRRVIQILSRRTKNNPVLIGEPGVGKTAVVEGLAQRIVAGDVPTTLQNKKLISLDLGSMVAGSKYRGEFEERLKSVLEEIKKADGQIITFIDEIHTITSAGESEGAMNAGNILKPALSRGEIQVIGATTFNEYRKYIEKDQALERRFQPVRVEEPSVSDTLAVMNGIKHYYEEHHHVQVPADVLNATVTLSERYITDRYLPDKAIDLLDEACACCNLAHPVISEYLGMQKELDALKQEEAEMESADVNEAIDYERVAERKTRIAKLESELPAKQAAASEIQVTMDDVAKVIELWTGIPAVKIQETEFVKLAGLEAELKKKIIGQDDAVHLVAQAVKRSRADLSGRRRPASFIFVGPTGVGKTELVKQLANQLFDGPDPLIRLDMSEYMEKYAVSRMIGSPPGYVGYEEAGQLTEKVRRRPYSVVLFDEIEKAHPDVMNILLQILDEGKINDAQGRTVDFSNTVICMTSNAGSSDQTTASLGFNRSEEERNEEKSRKALSQFLRPEFLGRVDEVITFKPLSEETLQGIAALMLDEYKPGMDAKGIAYRYTPAALKALVKKSEGGKFGARDLRRTIRKAVEDPAAEKIIDGTLVSGSTLTVDAENDEIVLK